MSRVTKIIAIAFGLVVIAIGAFFALFDANQLRGTIQSQLESGLKRKVSLGAIHLGLVPPELKIDDAVIGENPALVKAHELSVRVSLLPLLSKRVEINSLHLTEPVVELVETAPGHWNYQTPGEGSAGGSNTKLSIGELVIANGSVAVTSAGKPREVYEHIDLQLHDFAPGRPFTAELTMLLPKSLNLKAAVKGTQIQDGFNFDSLTADLGRLHLTGSGTYSDTNTNLALKVDRSSIADLAQVAAAFGKAFSPGMNVAGDASADLRLAGPSSNLAYSGIVNLTSLEVKESGWAQPVRVPAMRIDLAPHEIRTDTFTVESGTTKLTASALLNEYATDHGDYQATLRAPSADLGELLHMAAIYGGPTVSGLAASGKTSLDVNVKGKMAADSAVSYAGTATLDGASIRPKGGEPMQIDQASAKFSGAGAAAGSVVIGRLTTNGITLRNIHGTASMKGGIVTIDPLTADVGNGHQTGSLTIDTRSGVNKYALRTKVDKVDANELLSATTSLKQKIFGLLAANGNLRIAPKPGEDMARSLNGTFGLNLTKGKLAGVNMVNEMAGVAKLLGFRKQGDAVTNILGLTGNFQFNDGVAETKDLKMIFDGGSLTAVGTMNLVSQAINMKLTTTMSRAFADQFSGNKIGGLLTTALSSKTGELVVPMIVSGTAASPVFTPDTAEMARLRLSGIVPTNASDAVGKVSGAVDAVRKEGAKGLLDLLKSRKQ